MEHGSPPASAQEPMVPWLDAETQRIDARIAELEREKSDVEAFAAMAAHELLTSVVMIDAYATTAADHLDEGLQGEAHRDIDTLRRAAARTRLLVETLLHDARSHGRPLRRRAVDLNLVLRDCLTLLAPEINARSAEVHVAELPEVHGEQALIGAVFTNLLLNALRYGPRERGKIRVDATRENRARCFSVQSHGPTIPVADRERIFEPYHRGRGACDGLGELRKRCLPGRRRVPGVGAVAQKGRCALW